jgi:hypothetical protein
MGIVLTIIMEMYVRLTLRAMETSDTLQLFTMCATTRQMITGGLS